MARIPDAELEQLKTSVSLIALVEAKGIALVRHGADWLGHCPFHNDKTPSLVISPAKNLWHCLGACQIGGSVIDWVMKAEGVSFRHAIELLREAQGRASAASAGCARAANDLPVSAGSIVRQSTKPKLAAPVNADADDAALLQQVLEYYHSTLKQSPEALAYLQSRGLHHPELIDHFQLGFANRTLGLRLRPPWRVEVSKMQDAFFDPAMNRKAGAQVRERLQGLGLLRMSGHEHFNGSLVIPVLDLAGHVQELYGRKITRASKLTAGTPLHLYLPGPHRGVFNEAGLVGQDEIILCESLIDALTFWCVGYRNVTSAFGVEGFTDELLQALITHGVKRVLIAYDNDAAGNNAAEKLSLKLMSQGMECYRCHFPSGLDANALALEVPPAQEALSAVIRQAEWIGNGTEPQRVVSEPVINKNDDTSFLVAAASLDVVDEINAVIEKPIVVVEQTPAVVLPLPPLPVYRVPPSAPILAVEVDAKELRLTLGDREYTVRGIEKNLSYEQLKVWLRASKGNFVHVDTVELYQAKQRALWAKQTAIELGLSEDAVKADLGSLLRAVEQRQDELIRQRLTPSECAASKTPSWTTAQHDDALAWLHNPQLMSRISEDMNAIGVIGEEANALVGYLACVSRQLDKPLAVLIQSTSAAGKSTLMDALLSLMPENERVHYSAMTGQSLFYLGEGDLKHKILAIAEEEGVRQAAYALKLLQSQGELTIASTGKDPITGKLVTEEYRVEGPVMLFLTTTAIDIDEELLNRCLVLTINESREQTEAIHARQRLARTLSGLLGTQAAALIRTRHQVAQTLLRPVAVVNPYAEALTFRSESTRMRRDHAKYLTLMEAIAFLHQHQRPVHTATLGEKVIEYIEVTLDDIAWANRLAHEVLGRSLDDLPPQTRRVLGVLQSYVYEQAQARVMSWQDVRFTRKEIRAKAGMTDTALRVHLERLVELEYLIVHRGGFGSRFVYELLFDGDADANEPQAAGLLDVETLHRTNKNNQSSQDKSQSSHPETKSSQGKSQSSHSSTVNLTPTSHPKNTPFAPTSQGSEIPLIVSAGAGSSSLVAAVKETPLLRTPRETTLHRNGSAVVETH